MTRGFEDALEIGNQARRTSSLDASSSPNMLYAASSKRTSASAPMARSRAAGQARSCASDLEAARGPASRRRDLFYAWLCVIPRTRRQAEQIAREVGFTQVSVSHEVSPLIKIVGRGDTTVADAYLIAVLKRYVERVSRTSSRARRHLQEERPVMRRPRLLFMASSGGLTAAELFQGRMRSCRTRRRRRRHGRDRAARRASTASSASTWAARRPMSSHFAGEYERSFETEVAGVRMRAPMMRIHTVAAGGGSILHYRRRALSRRARQSPAPIRARGAIAAAARSPSPTPT